MSIMVLFDTCSEGQYNLLRFCGPDQCENTPGSLSTLLSLHFPNHYTPLCFCCTVPELASSLHSELGNSSGFPYQSDILSFSVFSLRVPTTPHASFPVGVQQTLDELKLSPSTSLLHTPTPSNSP